MLRGNTPPYKDEVIGRHVEIIRDQRWTPGGKICKVMMELPVSVPVSASDGAENNTKLLVRHFVMPSNGGGYWLDLVKSEKDGHLRWSSSTQKEGTTFLEEGTPPASKKIKTEPEQVKREENNQEEEKSYPAEHVPSNAIAAPDPLPRSITETERKQEGHLKRDENNEEEEFSYRAEQVLSNDVAAPDPLSRSVTKTYLQEGQLKREEKIQEEEEEEAESYPAEHALLPSNDIAVPDPLPSSITAIIRYMDQVEPGQNYYDRQADTRGECSGIRGKLRKFARAEANKNHKATKHYRETKKWQPPDEEALFALIALIKTMIK